MAKKQRAPKSKRKAKVKRKRKPKSRQILAFRLPVVPEKLYLLQDNDLQQATDTVEADESSAAKLAEYLHNMPSIPTDKTRRI
jgi:hypothetical protein